MIQYVPNTLNALLSSSLRAEPTRSGTEGRVGPQWGSSQSGALRKNLLRSGETPTQSSRAASHMGGGWATAPGCCGLEAPARRDSWARAFLSSGWRGCAQLRHSLVRHESPCCRGSNQSWVDEADCLGAPRSHGTVGRGKASKTTACDHKARALCITATLGNLSRLQHNNDLPSFSVPAAN